jgi:hypothetical protein
VVLPETAKPTTVHAVDSRNARLLFEKALLSYRLVQLIARNTFSKSHAERFDRSAICLPGAGDAD